MTDLDPFSPAAVGGAETSIRLLAERLAARDHDAVYVTKASGWWPVPSRPRLRRHGVRHVELRTLRGRARSPKLERLRKALLVRNLERIVARHDPHVAYAYYELENLQALLEVRARSGRPRIVLRMAGLRWHRECVRDPARVPEYERIFNEIDAVNFIHEELQSMTEELLRELGMRVAFRHRFVGDIGSSAEAGDRGPSSATAGRPRERSDAPFRIVMASRLSPYQKRQDLIVEAAALLDPSVPVSIELIGSGSERASLQARIDRRGLADTITLRPFMPQTELWERLRSADLMCHACDFEGLGKILLESMAVGLPVLASNVAPLNSLIQDGINGFLVDNEPAAWAERITQLATATASRERVARNAMDFVRRTYDPDPELADVQ